MRPGTSVRDFFDQFPDEDSCLEHVFQTMEGPNRACPSCKRKGKWYRAKKRKMYQHRCGFGISPLQNTLFHQTHMPLRVWFYVLLLFGNCSNGLSSDFIARHLGLNQLPAQRICNSVRMQMLACKRPAQIGGEGVHVHIDEALLGGVLDREGKTAPKVSLFGMAGSGFVISGVVPDRSRATLFPLIERHVLPGSIIVTDAHKIYFSLKEQGWSHIVIDHSRAWHNFEGVTQNPIEVYWSCVKRCMRGVYQNVRSENIWKYLGEIEFRYNRRSSHVPLFIELISAFPDIGGYHAKELRRLYDWR